MSRSPLCRNTADIARKHPRVSLIAAAAAAAGVLCAASSAAGAAPWAQAAGNVAKTAQGGSKPAAGQPGASFFEAITGVTSRDGNALAGGQPLTVRSAGAAGSSGATAASDHAAGRHPAKTPPAASAADARHPAKHAPKRQAEHRAGGHQATRHKAAKPKAHRVHARPFRIYDSVSPGAIPSGEFAAVYSNGSYAASSSQVAGHHSVLWIDTNGSDPSANVLDVEPGDATPAGAAQWVKHRLNSRPHSVAIVYTMRSEWQQVKDNVAHLPGWMRSKVRYWIADPTGVPHIVVGASATQWYWGHSYDITTANPDFIR